MIRSVNIKPISVLNQYPKVLDEVKVGSPVYLTKNGRGKYVIFDIDDPAIIYVENHLLTEDILQELVKIEEESDRDGWLKKEDINEAINKVLEKHNK